MDTERDDELKRQELLEADLARLLGSALAAPARPLSYEQECELAREVARHWAPAFPRWAAVACVAGLLALALLALSLPAGMGELRLLALAVPAANLLLGPLAAAALIWRRRPGSQVAPKS